MVLYKRWGEYSHLFSSLISFRVDIFSPHYLCKSTTLLETNYNKITLFLKYANQQKFLTINQLNKSYNFFST